MIRTAVDPVTLSTVWHFLQSTCREMRYSIQRSAQAHLIAILGDVSVSLYTHDARTVAVPEGLMAQVMAGKYSVRYVLDDYRGDIYPGDVFILNDPYHGYNVHLPDWGFFRPIFYKGELLFWTLARAHQMDTGGAYPGGYFPNGYDIHAEGLCFPPIKVYDRGQECKDIWKFIWNNVRFPEGMKIDVAAMMASLKGFEDRMVALLDHYGKETVLACIEEMLARSERAMRAEIARIPDGTYSGESASDDDGTELDVPIWVRCDVTIQGDEMTIDFSRSDSQRKGFVNLAWYGTYSTTMGCAFVFLAPDLAEYHNEGSMAPIHVVAPEGSIVNPRYPATVGGSPISVGMQLSEAVAMALSKAMPERAIASWGRRYGQYMFGTDPRTGEGYVWCPFDPDGGAGAMYGFDGHQGPASSLTALGNVQRSNVEEAELRFPWRYKQYEFTADRMGHGRWRGAPGVVWEVENWGPEAGLPTGNGDGERTYAPGALGGLAAPLYKAFLTHGEEREPMHTHRMYFARTGDGILRFSGGGGGVESPLERGPELVQKDVRNGIVTPRTARDVYGVSLDPKTLEIDRAETVRLRAAKR